MGGWDAVENVARDRPNEALDALDGRLRRWRQREQIESVDGRYRAIVDDARESLDEFLEQNYSNPHPEFAASLGITFNLKLNFI
jgi:hypothetical protein